MEACAAATRLKWEGCVEFMKDGAPEVGGRFFARQASLTRCGGFRPCSRSGPNKKEDEAVWIAAQQNAREAQLLLLLNAEVGEDFRFGFISGQQIVADGAGLRKGGTLLSRMASL